VKLCGLRNLVVFGRAITFVLQNLRSTESEFEEWYTNYREQMESDPLMVYFKNIRNELEKEGSLRLSVRTYIKSFNYPQDIARFGPPPLNAKAFFMGDHLGGSGWEVVLPDGSTRKYYINLPSDIGTVSLHFPQSPKYHLGKRIEDNSIETMSRAYLNYLNMLVREAKEKFE
jgi:hypothetical protein